MDLSLFEGYPQVEKSWGKEIWLCNTPLYCAKFLALDAGQQCSLHYHPIKTETFIILEGQLLVQLASRSEAKAAGDSVLVPAGTPHRFAGAYGPALLLEVSTFHSDDDVVRLEPSGPYLPF